MKKKLEIQHVTLIVTILQIAYTLMAFSEASGADGASLLARNHFYPVSGNYGNYETDFDVKADAGYKIYSNLYDTPEDFHDSCVNKLEYRDNSIFLDIDLYMWKQNDYKEGQQELKRVVLKVLDVKNYN